MALSSFQTRLRYSDCGIAVCGGRSTNTSSSVGDAEKPQIPRLGGSGFPFTLIGLRPFAVT